MAEKQAWAFLKQIAKAAGPLFPEVDPSVFEALGLTPEDVASGRSAKAVMSYKEFLEAFVARLPRSSFAMEGSPVARAQLMIFRIATGRGAIPGNVRRMFNERLMSAFVAGVSLLAIPNRYMSESALRSTLDQADSSALAICRQYLRGACATLLSTSSVRFFWRVHGREMMHEFFSAIRKPILGITARRRRQVRFDLLATSEGALALCILGGLVFPTFARDQWGDGAVEETRAWFEKFITWINGALTGSLSER